MDCGKTPERTRMPFGVIGRTGPGMRQVVGFGNPSTGRGNFGGKYGAPHCKQWGTFYYWEFPLRRGDVCGWRILGTVGATDGRCVQAAVWTWLARPATRPSCHVTVGRLAIIIISRHPCSMFGCRTFYVASPKAEFSIPGSIYDSSRSFGVFGVI